ncbi:MAG: hypothetical protein WDA71_00050 [Actinomycetota bacterium]
MTDQRGNEAESRAYFEVLDSRDTETLREWAFNLAEHRVDVGFFWGLARHVPVAASLAANEPIAAPGKAIADAIEFFREIRGEHDESVEPLLRAAYLDYLVAHMGVRRYGGVD